MRALELVLVLLVLLGQLTFELDEEDELLRDDVDDVEDATELARGCLSLTGA